MLLFEYCQAVAQLGATSKVGDQFADTLQHAVGIIERKCRTEIG